MYTPSHFSETDTRRMYDLVRENPFATLISSSAGRVSFTQIPMISEAGDVLIGHMARANPQWQTLGRADDVVAVFSGPHAYISPTWYENDGVPTWNYATVQVRGSLEVFDDPARLHILVMELSSRFEAPFAQPWDGVYDERKLRGIIGIKMSVDEIEGKFKLSQNRTATERSRVRQMLNNPALSEAQRLADMMADLDPKHD